MEKLKFPLFETLYMYRLPEISAADNPPFPELLIYYAISEFNIEIYAFKDDTKLLRFK